MPLNPLTRVWTVRQAAYEEDLDAVFDVAAVRAALEARLRSLESELHQARAAPHPPPLVSSFQT